MKTRDYVHAALTAATPSHGRFSQWNRKQETLTIPLALLRDAFDGNAHAKVQLAAILDRADPVRPFMSWAHENGSGMCLLPVSTLRELVEGA